MKITGRVYRKQPVSGNKPHNPQALFSIGQLVRHKKFDYRGVIIDVDACFQGSDEWYEQVARSRPPKNKPWYHVLVDNATHQTYIAERHLEADKKNSPINHPLVDTVLGEFSQGRYLPKTNIN